MRNRPFLLLSRCIHAAGPGHHDSAHVPTKITVLIGILINNSQLNDVNSRYLRVHMHVRFEDMCATWQSELHRVEKVFDARLKHLEER